ncbi:MAG: hypothetical protein JWN94_910 [Betaproteobacteria bacterium]|nr:hypothetical protein [Betaproteobacteria bacterium]
MTHCTSGPLPTLCRTTPDSFIAIPWARWYMDDGALPPNACQTCGHINSADAKFCSSCGGLLIPAPGRAQEAPEPLFSPDIARRTPRSTSRVLIGIAAAAVAVILGFEGYDRVSQFFTGVPENIQRTIRLAQPYGGFIPPPATAENTYSEATARESAGAGGGSGDTGDGTVAKVKEYIRALKPVTASPEPPRTDAPPPAPAQPAPASASAPAIASPPASAQPAPAPASAPPPETRATESPPAQPPAQRSCTQAMAALGLCKVEQASASKPRPETEEARKAQGAQEQTRQQGCNAATTALGLCRS